VRVVGAVDELRPGALEAASRRVETPCGDGVMVWHLWGAGPPLVLLHGGAGSWRHWIHTIPHFARTRLVLAADLPGLGESDLPPELSPDGVAAVVSQGIAALIGAAEYDLTGFSFGSHIATRVAARDGVRVRSLTLVGAGGLGTGPRALITLEKVRQHTGELRVAAHRTNLQRLMIANPARIDALALELQEWNSSHARLNSRSFATSSGLRDVLQKVSARRVNAIWGERDAVTVHDLPARLAAVAAVRPEADIRVIPEAGHWVAYEAPAAFNAMLEEMLA
jgi:pimeloyl-ACP methyl ester carboxylesterase